MSRFRLAPLLLALATPLAAQRVPVTLVASLTGENGKTLPVSGRFWFVRSDGDSVLATTDGTGNARVDLVPGDYRVRSHQRASLGGRGFFWDLPVTVTGATTVALSSANAQESAPSGDVIVMDAPPPPQDAGSRRRGFWIGFGPAVGWVSCEDCDNDTETVGAGTFQLGGTVSPRLRVGFSSDVWVKEQDGNDESQANLTAVVQYFPSTRHGLRFTGGLGLSVLTRNEGDTSFDEEGFGVTLGIAYEAMVARKFALAPYLSLHSGSFDHGNSHFWMIGLAATWP